MTGRAATRVYRAVIGVLFLAGVVVVPEAFAEPSPQRWIADDSWRSGTYATRGVVQAIDAHMMVIARPRGRGTIAFNITRSTRQEGAIVVGSPVSVRYREEGGDRIATAIALHRPQR